MTNIAGKTCSATTKQGTPCRAPAAASSPYCALHGNPGRAAELGRLGGRKNRHYVETADVAFTPPSTPEEVKNILAQTMVEVRAGKLHPQIGHTITYVAGALMKAIEGTDLQHRVARLEEELRAKADKL